MLEQCDFHLNKQEQLVEVISS